MATWGSAELYPEDACYIGFESHQGNEAHQAMPFKGVLDEALVFGRALTLADVTSGLDRMRGRLVTRGVVRARRACPGRGASIAQ